MKILYLTGFDEKKLPFDYLRDGILHGLKKLYGEQVIDYPGCWTMYKDEIIKRNFDINTLWGKGFNLIGTLDNYNSVDRTDIKNKIKKNFFDLIIFSINLKNKYNLLADLEIFKNKIIFIDGEDDQQIRTEYLSKGLYFKRELVRKDKNIFPISFSIPEEKISKFKQKKNFIVSPMIPGIKYTYIYKKEKDYNDMYQKSLFALTYKKTGWDCFRHYEILMNGALPLFLDLENCPEGTCSNLPKNKLIKIKNSLINFIPKDEINLSRKNKNIKMHYLFYKIKKFLKKDFDIEYFYKKNPKIFDDQEFLINYTQKKLTTISQVKSIISKI